MSIPIFSSGSLQINPSQKQREFLVGEPDSVALSLFLRPAEATPLQPFRANPKSVAIPEQYFKPITRLVAEQKQMAASGLELEPITHQSVQSIKALSHIGGSNRQIDPGRRSDSKHGSPYALSKTAIRACNVVASNPGRTSTLRPRPNTTSIALAFWTAFSSNSIATRRGVCLAPCFPPSRCHPSVPSDKPLERQKSERFIQPEINSSTSR